MASEHMPPSPERSGGRPMTGRKFLAIMIGAFAVILAANLAMLFAATGTFPGLVVENSYVASQEFNRKADAQRALGWTAAATWEKGVLTVRMTGRDGRPVEGLTVAAVVGRPASVREDVRLDLAAGDGGYSAPIELAPGRWRVDISATGKGGETFEAEGEFLTHTPNPAPTPNPTPARTQG